ncbi:MAG: response regulator transcription factor [Chitinophagaceae bacterium]|nr:MAG: response regulator transcription factor [Chitinophagaceae bacterium]
MQAPSPDSRPLRCLVVDDEPPARALLCRYISDMPALSLQGECGNALEALQLLQREGTDLLFLDINMPQLKGTELLRILRQPPRTILTTAHPDYALEGYELDVSDYLLKPIRFERFVKAVSKVLQLERPFAAVPAPPPEADEARSEPFIYVRCDRKMVRVNLEEIRYIESMKDYVKVYTDNGLLITKQSITSMEALLPEKDFVRAHRSFIVACSKVKAYTPELLEIGAAELPIGKLYRQQVMKALGNVP